jgi:Fe-S-cluster formation regulator IscX/YfhJ
MDIGRVHKQDSAFFAEDKKYLKFEEFLAKNQVDPRKVPFTELSFKVCGYGYFEKYRQNMKLKFREYLWDATQSCPDLTSLQIVFNGFSVNSAPKES